MNITKKAAALLLSIILVLSSTAISLTASALSIEEAVQYGLKIANDDKHGYSQANRWGPDYDCSSFVLSCLQQAGFNTGNAYTTHSMKQELTRHGFKWYPWSTIGDLSNLRRGDVLLDEDYHTEFYIGRGQDLGAFQDYNHPESGDQSGSEICISSYYSYNWDGVLRYTNDIPKVKPTDVELETYTSSCGIGENIYFSLFSINAAEQYIVISKDGKQVDRINVTDKYEYNHSFKDSGTYSCVLTAKNKLGETSSTAKVIRVYKSKPTDVKLSSDKVACRAGESIRFTFSSKEAETQWLEISDGSWWGGENVDVTGKKDYTKKFEEAGDYYVSLSAYNPIGSEYTNQRRIVVYDKAPTDMYIYPDSYHNAIGDDVVLSLRGSGAARQILDISIDGIKYNTIDASGEVDYTLKTAKPGVYSVTLTGENEFGSDTSDPCEFVVYDKKPDTPTITANRYCDINNDLYFDINAQHASQTRLDIFDGSGSLINTEEYSANSWAYYKFPHTGDYTYRLTAINPIGETSSALKKVTVYDEPPKDLYAATDRIGYILGEEVKFNCEAKNFSRAELEIRRDGYYDRYFTLDDNTEIVYTPEYCGEYTYSLEASNSYGSDTAAEGKFTVYDRLPYDLTITSDKPAYSVGEQVIFTIGGTYAVDRTIIVTAENGDPQKFEIGNSDTFEISFDKIGKYTYYLSAKNEFGEAVTDEKTFDVYSGKPAELDAYTEKTKYRRYEEVTIKLQSKNASKQHLTIYCNAKAVEDVDVTGMDEYRFTPYNDGLYIYMFSASNSFGEEQIPQRSFNVSDSLTVTFDANGGIDAPEPKTVYSGYNIGLGYDEPVNGDRVFLGWSSNPNALTAQYHSGEYIDCTQDTTLYAVWGDQDYMYREFALTRWIWNDDGTALAVFTENGYPDDYKESPDDPEKSDTPDSPDTATEHHSFALMADISHSTAKEPTCTDEGEIIYTASVMFEGRSYSDEKTVKTAPTGHNYRLTRWEWQGTEMATPYFECRIDSEHCVTAESVITREVIENNFTIRYTAAAEYEGKTYTSEKTVKAFSIGDIDSDRDITSADALAILRLSVGIGSDKTRIDLCDVDGDSDISSADALVVLRTSIGYTADSSHIGQIVD